MAHCPACVSTPLPFPHCVGCAHPTRTWAEAPCGSCARWAAGEREVVDDAANIAALAEAVVRLAWEDAGRQAHGVKARGGCCGDPGCAAAYLTDLQGAVSGGSPDSAIEAVLRIAA